MAKPTVEEMWRRMLTGDVPRLRTIRRVWGALPTPPRCKLCNAPFRGPGRRSDARHRVRALAAEPAPLQVVHPCGLIGILAAPRSTLRCCSRIFVARRRWPSRCRRKRSPSLWRTSTVPLRTPSTGATASSTSSSAMRRWHSSSPGSRGRTMRPGRLLPRGASSSRPPRRAVEPSIPIGVGIHTGRSYVGSVGEGDARDFTAVGDTVNAASRLCDLAGIGEILISADAASAAGIETSGLERRTLELRGRAHTLDAWVAAGAT